ncbi:toll/interleukin-1 receptor domain-containing protein [Saccharothrix texasensis]|uniref:TIR domain-containing protein n=1 Tax=Saccharothrix texasensis TaxID=103734 RepID=A0A3N1H8W3_9PSEU|nr:toll/interleukin-1 receptor domain-containing protein [Saccharothrix texasensis]ROP38977.1 TIR domain-containing protein [Saccharothrix texasensis]
MPSDEAKHVFVSYVREDAEKVDQLCQALEAANIPYWRDRTSLAPGDHWKQKIRDAVRSGALVFLACFSEQSRAKGKSYMNEELSLAVEEFRMLPPGATWLIPVRFDDGDIPQWDLGAGRMLGDLNYADLFGDRYVPNLVSLTTTISQVFGTTGVDAATVRASVEEADDAEKPAKLRRMTKDMILNSAKRIELDDLISQETQHILTAMRDEERFPIQRLEGTGEDQVVRCAEVAADYWQLAEPFCASLQVAARWGEGQALAPWVAGLRAIAGEALKSKSGMTALLELQHVPALIATFTAAFAATGQARWDNLKTLLVDTTVSQRYGAGRDPLMQVENPWTPFGDMSHWLPSVVARVAKTGEEARTALKVFTGNHVGKYRTPVAEWLHTILQPHFADQYVDDTAYDDAFDRAEVMLGLISQDFDNARAVANSDQTREGRSVWFGRSTWRGRYGSRAVGIVASEVEVQGASWAPLEAGLFGGQLDRAVTAIKDYEEAFNRIARLHW